MTFAINILPLPESSFCMIAPNNNRRPEPSRNAFGSLLALLFKRRGVGIAAIFGLVAVLGGAGWGGVIYLLMHSDAYVMASARVQSSDQAADLLGAPISCGFPMGNISTSKSDGDAVLTFSATGSKARGSVMVEAIKQNGVWSLQQVILIPEDGSRAIELN